MSPTKKVCKPKLEELTINSHGKLKLKGEPVEASSRGEPILIWRGVLSHNLREEIDRYAPRGANAYIPGHPVGMARGLPCDFYSVQYYRVTKWWLV